MSVRVNGPPRLVSGGPAYPEAKLAPPLASRAAASPQCEGNCNPLGGCSHETKVEVGEQGSLLRYS